MLFNKDQNELFSSQEEQYKDHIRRWYLVNVITPIIIILLPTFFMSFLPPDRTNFQNLILNGSFSLLGINVLMGMSTLLINTIKLKDQKFEKQISQLRQKLIIYLCIFLFLGTVLYWLQIALNIDSVGRYSTTTVGCFVILVLSISIGKRIFLLKDELVGKPFNEDVNDSVNDLTNSVDDLG